VRLGAAQLVADNETSAPIVYILYSEDGQKVESVCAVGSYTARQAGIVLGVVYAPDEAAARKEAINEFKVRPEQPSSLLIRKV
jgi:hypothetical protein